MTEPNIVKEAITIEEFFEDIKRDTVDKNVHVTIKESPSSLQDIIQVYSKWLQHGISTFYRKRTGKRIGQSRIERREFSRFMEKHKVRVHKIENRTNCWELRFGEEEHTKIVCTLFIEEIQ